MSGHSHWAGIKRKKEANDKQRAKSFAKLIRNVEVAARDAGTSNPGNNMTLAAAVERARQGSVPSDTIERACKRGAGELEGVSYERIVYEGYGPGGAALLVETLTDNRNRTGQDVRTAFTRGGGSIGEPGSVSWMFERRGAILVDASASEDDVLAAASEAGAEDIRADGDYWEVTCDVRHYQRVKLAVEAAGLKVVNAEIAMIPTTKVDIDTDKARAVLCLMDALEDLDDVQDVYMNFDIPEELLTEAG